MSDDRGDVSATYDRWAPSYDEAPNATRDLDAQVLRRARLTLAGRDVLELGCGTGKNTVWLAEHARLVTAMDVSPGMLARARERVGAAHVRFVRHDLREEWPLASQSVDVVVGNLVLEHVADLPPLFAEAWRVLRPAGQLFLSELHPYRQWRGGQAHFIDGETGETVRVTAYRHSVSEYVNGAVAAGFTLDHLGEWLEEGAPADAPPRLLSLLFGRR